MPGIKGGRKSNSWVVPVRIPRPSQRYASSRIRVVFVMFALYAYFLIIKVVKGKDVDKDPTLWGRPGHLTSEEADVYFKFKDEVAKRGEDFKDTLFCFGEEEGEVFALCRWLRARKYVYDDVITMVEEATEVRKDAKANNFYPNPVDALGCEASLFYAQYPQLYSGNAKVGVPLFISKPGILNVDGMETITTLDGILKFHWFIMMHDFAKRLRAQKAKDPENFKR